LSPIEAFSALLSDDLDGGHYDASVTNATLNWVPRDSTKTESAAPEDLLGARAWEFTEDALEITVSGEGEHAVFTRDIDGVRAGHLVIRFAPNAHRTLVIDNRGCGSLTENVVILVGEGSQAKVVHIGGWGDASVHNAAHTATIAKSAHLDHILVSLTGAVQRVNPSFLLSGAGGGVYSAGAYFADRGRHIEHRVFVNHIAPNTLSDVLYKGALHGAGTRTVWVGDVLIGRGASGTKSYEANRNLVLSDGDDPLESGIDVIAKPPGKKPTTITLLSGGERSMTAVALLFSIYMVKPSPFCVLDELDAPLDESNIGRFLNMLDQFIDKSQFVIVTHNKKTMRRADVMYGITMEEFGVSKPVGVKLTAEEKAEPKPRRALNEEPVAESIVEPATEPATETAAD
jgi:hypothetical protein